MTDQNGVASIVPSVGSVGPCDVFITVSAGQLTAQFQMESVGAIVPERTQKQSCQGPHRSPRSVSDATGSDAASGTTGALARPQ